MYGIDILLKEHENILRFLETLKNANLRILKTGQVDVEYFKKSVDFIREYADNIHHGKEEEFLFKEMQKELGVLGSNLIDHGMLVEHDLAKFNVMSLEKSLNRYEKEKTDENILDIITYSMAYRDLLIRHIDKENRVVYEYAKKSLDGKILESVDLKTRNFQEKIEESGELKKYIESLEEFEAEYL